ncbi:hypothetical protein RRG08_030897 [Elysia crispata]|uniref:Uncharacterized protein n=1 Tax=Elysia crispata TaxID=231223 RepID=A0AAE1AG36_9GAST|nr:hypothetical protein RRG08_030897 [Elysia crispata]
MDVSFETRAPSRSQMVFGLQATCSPDPTLHHGTEFVFEPNQAQSQSGFDVLLIFFMSRPGFHLMFNHGCSGLKSAEALKGIPEKLKRNAGCTAVEGMP